MQEIMIARRPLIAARVQAATAKSREARQRPHEQRGGGDGRGGATTTPAKGIGAASRTSCASGVRGQPVASKSPAFGTSSWPLWTTPPLHEKIMRRRSEMEKAPCIKSSNGPVAGNARHRIIIIARLGSIIGDPWHVSARRRMFRSVPLAAAHCSRGKTFLARRWRSAGYSSR